MLHSSQVPETLIGALTELEQEYTKAMNDPSFKVRPASPSWLGKCFPLGCSHLLRALRLQAEFAAILKDYVGRESPLYHAERLSEHYRRCFPMGVLLRSPSAIVAYSLSLVLLHTFVLEGSPNIKLL